MTEHHKDYLGDKFGMWLFLFTEILLFGGLFLLYSVYLHRYPAEFHQAGLELSRVFGTANTIVLITSSFTVALAISALQQGRRVLCQGLLASTIVLAGVFMVNKYFEWSAKIGHGIYPGSPELVDGPGGTNIFFGLYYIMTGAHGLHVIIGAALSEAGAGMKDVVRTRIFVTDASKFDDIAKAHGEVFGDIRPATTIVEVSRLVDACFMVEIEAVAVL